jgi:glycosyltransferase involved in cell wall biosynthesis
MSFMQLRRMPLEVPGNERRSPASDDSVARLRLVYVAGSIIPSRTANSIHIMKMCAALGHNGHDVTLVIPDRPERAQSVSDVFGYYGTDPVFRIVALPWLRVPGRSLPFAWLAARLAEGLRPDFVYGRTVQACYFSVLRGIPTIFESHVPLAEYDRVGAWMFTRMIPHAELRRVVVTSDALRRHYEQEHPALLGRLRTAPDGADEVPEAAPHERAQHDGRDVLKVGYVGHLYRGRGVELIAELARRCSWAEFHVIGGMQHDIEEWRRRCAAITNLVFHGFCPPAQVQAHMARLDVMLAPYQRRVAIYGNSGDTSRWMSPLKIFEYMAARKPMIASDMPVLREVLDDSNAILVDPEDVDAWQNALTSLRDPERCEQLGTKAHQDFVAYYTWRARADRVLE